MPRRLKPPEAGKYRIICPHCQAEFKHNISKDYTYIKCQKCKENFKVLLTTVRAKRGRDGVYYKEYIIRYVGHSGEGLIEFGDSRHQDLDVRSSDLILLAFVKEDNGKYSDTPSLLINVTINKGIQVQKPPFY